MVGHLQSVRLGNDTRETSPDEKPPPQPLHHHHPIPHEALDHLRRIIQEELDARVPKGGSDGPMTGSQLRREPFGDFVSVMRDGDWHTVLAPAGTASARSKSKEHNSGLRHQRTQESGANQVQGDGDALPEEDIEHQAGESEGATTGTAEPSPEDEVKQKDENDEAKPQQETNPDHESQQPDGAGKRKGKIPPNETLMRSADLLNKRKTMARPDGVLTAEPAVLHDLERRVEKLHGIQRTFPNPIARFRYEFREPLAEFLGTFVLYVFFESLFPY